MARRRHRFAHRRRTCGYSQETFAEAVGVDRTAVSRWETAATAPQPWHRHKIARVLKVSLEELDELLANLVEVPDEGRSETPPGAVDVPVTDAAGEETRDGRQDTDVMGGEAIGSLVARAATRQDTGVVARSHDAAEVSAIDNAQSRSLTPAAVSPVKFATILGQATGQGVEETNRRQVLTWALGTAVGAAPLEVEDRLAAEASGVGHRSLADLPDAAELLASMYRTVDPRVVLSMAATYADELLDLYDQRAGVTGRDLAEVVVGVHCQVGLWACHAHQPAQARRYLATACEVAAGANDPPLYARALGALSYLHSSAPRGGSGGNPARTLQLLTQALALTGTSDAFTRGWLATWRADQHATLGDLPAAQADVDLADTALDTGDSGPERGFFARRHYGYGMRGHLDSVRGLVHALAGEFDESEQIFRNVQEHAANSRRRVASLSHQALAYTRVAQPEAACQALGRSIALAVADPYPMGVTRAIGVRAGFDQGWKSLPYVHDLDQRLLQVTTAGS